jgi:hypothetical protein
MVTGEAAGVNLSWRGRMGFSVMKNGSDIVQTSRRPTMRRYVFIWVCALFLTGIWARCAERRHGGGGSAGGGGGGATDVPEPSSPLCEIRPGDWTATYTKHGGTCDDIEPQTIEITRTTLDCGTFLVLSGCRCDWDPEECRVTTTCSLSDGEASALVEQDIVRVDAETFRGVLIMSIHGGAGCNAQFDIEMRRSR